MSKKKKFRLKARQKAQILAQLEKNERQNFSIAAQESKPNLDIASAKTVATPRNLIVNSEQSLIVKSEIKRIAAIMGLIALLLIGMTLVDKKANFSLRYGRLIITGLGI